MNSVKPLVAVVSMVAVGIGIYVISEQSQHPISVKTTAVLTPSSVHLESSKSEEHNESQEPSSQEGKDISASVDGTNKPVKPAEPDDMLSMVPGAIPGMMPMQVISPAIIQSVKSFHADDANKKSAQQIQETSKVAELKNKSITQTAGGLNDADLTLDNEKRFTAKSRYNNSSRHLAQLHHKRIERWHVARAAKQGEAAQL